MDNSIYHYLEKNQKPRVHIKYEVETESGTEERELPFVIGVVGDFAADNANNQTNLKEREFMVINRDNFDEVMTKINPRLELTVNNVLNSDKTLIPLSLSFCSLKDFEPDQLITQIEPLYKLKLARDRLQSLLNQAECSESLEKNLELILNDHEQLNILAKDLKTKIAENRKEMSVENN